MTPAVTSDIDVAPEVTQVLPDSTTSPPPILTLQDFIDDTEFVPLDTNSGSPEYVPLDPEVLMDLLPPVDARDIDLIDDLYSQFCDVQSNTSLFGSL